MTQDGHFIQVHMKASDLMEAMQETGMPMAIICDPEGKTERFTLIVNFGPKGMGTLPMSRADVEVTIEVLKKALETTK